MTAKTRTRPAPPAPEPMAAPGPTAEPVPGFAPLSRPLDPPLSPEESDTMGLAQDALGPDRLGPTNRSLRDRLSGLAGGIRTATSSGGGDLDPAVAVRLVGVAVTAVVMLAALSVRTRRGRTLRRPTAAERDAIATPIARVVSRRVPGILSADLADVAEASHAVSEYLAAGPLTELLTDPGVPPDLHRTDDDDDEERPF